jgi:hypothetical protein
MVDFHEIRQAGHAIEDDMKAIIFNPIASTIWTEGWYGSGGAF